MRELLLYAPVLLGCLMTSGQSAVAQPAAGLAACDGPESGPAYSITAVVDGETVVLDDGRELRLTGALAPRALDVGAAPGTWGAESRAHEALRALVLGKSVELGFGGERIDRYGRLQAQAYLIEGDRRRWVQGNLLEQGLARAYTAAGNRVCAQALLAAEREAREARRGLWAEAAYQVRSADAPVELLRLRTTFQVVEGKIGRVAVVRNVVYLNFDRNWRRAFSVLLRYDDRTMLGAYAGNPKVLEGHVVRVSGWIEQRDSTPVLDLSAGQIEVISGAHSRIEQAP